MRRRRGGGGCDDVQRWRDDRRSTFSFQSEQNIGEVREAESGGETTSGEGCNALRTRWYSYTPNPFVTRKLFFTSCMVFLWEVLVFCGGMFDLYRAPPPLAPFASSPTPLPEPIASCLLQTHFDFIMDERLSRQSPPPPKSIASQAEMTGGASAMGFKISKMVVKG